MFGTHRTTSLQATAKGLNGSVMEWEVLFCHMRRCNFQEGKQTLSTLPFSVMRSGWNDGEEFVFFPQSDPDYIYNIEKILQVGLLWCFTGKPTISRRRSLRFLSWSSVYFSKLELARQCYTRVTSQAVVYGYQQTSFKLFPRLLIQILYFCWILQLVLKYWRT